MKSSNECSGVGDYVHNEQDQFYKAHRAYPSLGDPMKESGNFCLKCGNVAEACGIPCFPCNKKRMMLEQQFRKC
ncbi:hypothetical protein NC652_035685 [Populus alba x Populus x berolinensis]|nr:hypothetical protein NC652_035685 [Populus alba x Populus x berolinensis]